MSVCPDAVKQLVAKWGNVLFVQSTVDENPSIRSVAKVFDSATNIFCEALSTSCPRHFATNRVLFCVIPFFFFPSCAVVIQVFLTLSVHICTGQIVCLMMSLRALCTNSSAFLRFLAVRDTMDTSSSRTCTCPANNPCGKNDRTPKLDIPQSSFYRSGKWRTSSPARATCAFYSPSCPALKIHKRVIRSCTHK